MRIFPVLSARGTKAREHEDEYVDVVKEILTPPKNASDSILQTVLCAQPGSQTVAYRMCALTLLPVTRTLDA
jgi:hypothetical protein